MKKLLSRRGLMLLLLFTVMAVGLSSSPPAQAQNGPVLTLSVPGFWEDLLTDEVLAEFESQYGVQVHVEFGPGAIFIESGGDTDLESRLETTSNLSSSADVIYVDSSDVVVEDTQAGYFLNLAPLANNDPNLDINDFIPAVWQSYQWDQGIWVLPLSTDVILLTYDPAAFDAAGVAYPTENWTIDDFANAVRQLAQYNADGTVAVPGFALGPIGDITMLLRAFTGQGFYDPMAMPSSPRFSNLELENILTTWQTLLDEGVVSNTITLIVNANEETSIPLQLDGSLGYSQGPNQDNTRQAALLPGGTAGLNVQGFAVSSGTQYPELAYELAKFLTTRPEISDNPFAVAPARYSLAEAQTNGNGNGNNQGGPGGGRFFGGSVPEQIQSVIDEALPVAMPVSELRYAYYLNNALTEMSNNGGDAQLALQTIEAVAVDNQQAAIAHSATVSVTVETPAPVVELASGEVELAVGVNTGFGFVIGGPGGGQFPNQESWDVINDEFVANESVVGRVNMEPVNNNDLDTLSEQYDCFILSENVVAGNDVSSLLNLDPLLDTDPNFDRNDIIGNALVQLQQENRTYGIPIVVQPQMLQYDTQLFSLAGVPEPVEGWTIDEFASALQLLSNVVDSETAPFVPNDPSGAYINMLVAAYGGLPIDYRTDPPTLNFTDPATVDAIRHALNLAVDGYIDYSELSTVGGDVSISFGETYAITTDLFRGVNFTPGGPDGPDGEFTTENTSAVVLYPQGSQYGVISYNLFAGYVSATAENPEACYRWLSSVAQNPQVFSGMPARRSLLDDPDVVASMDAETLAMFNQVDAIMQNPNTIVFPSIIGGGRGATNFLTEYWLKQAYDAYVLEGADLEIELMAAEATTQAYLDCVATLPPTDPNQDNGFGAFQGLQECAQRADPEFSFGP